MRTILIVMALALGGCAAQHASIYTRTDGGPVDPAKEQAVFAQCKGEVVTTPVPVGNGSPVSNMIGTFTGPQKEATVLDACMARNGYIQAQQ
jgi:hypothetical protein